MMGTASIPIGTLVDGRTASPLDDLESILDAGFESIQLTFWQFADDVDLRRLAGAAGAMLETRGVRPGTIGVYGNPLEHDEAAERTRASLRVAIKAAEDFGTGIVSAFTGRLRGTSIDSNMDRLVEVWTPLCSLAASRGVRIAFENCAMGGGWKTGDWNLAHGPDAWELIFEALEDAPVGLEWEPCHQMINLIDPLPQLDNWADRIFHVHGKCANVDLEVVRKWGVRSSHPYAAHRFPGLGDVDWRVIFEALEQIGYAGTIDIEGWHDPVFKDDREMEGQCNALTYLKDRRAAAGK